MVVIKRDDMEDIKHDFNEAESTNSTALTARERIRQSGLHRVCFESYNSDEFEFAHSIINKDFDILEKSNNDEFISIQKMEVEIIARFCHGVMKTNDVDQFRLMNHWTLQLAVAIEHEIIAARQICFQRNVLTSSNAFIYVLFEIASRIGKAGFLLCCSPNGDINNLIMLAANESTKSFPNLQTIRDDDNVSFSSLFLLDMRLDESLDAWANIKKVMKPRKSI
jgi:hypothetical protein